MMQQAKQLPVTLMEVRPISMIASTPMITVTAAIGNPYYASRISKTIRDFHAVADGEILPVQRYRPAQ